MSSGTLHLICGSTGAGKTTYALALAGRIGAMHFSIDDWMARLFWADSPQPIRFEWTIERVERCEAQILALALELSRLGVASVLDLGFPRVEHRARVIETARAAGAPAKLHFVDVPAAERWRRVGQRNAERGETYRLEVTAEMFEFVEGIWEPPTDAELAATDGVRVAG